MKCAKLLMILNVHLTLGPLRVNVYTLCQYTTLAPIISLIYKHSELVDLLLNLLLFLIIEIPRL